MVLGRHQRRPSFCSRRFNSLRLIGFSSRRSATIAKSCRSSSSLSYCSNERSTPVFRPFESTTYCSRAAIATTLPNFSICINPRPDSSHPLGNANSQRCQRRGQLPSGVISHGNQHSALRCVLFGDNAMAVIEEVEGLRQVESVLRQKSRLGAGNSLGIRFFETRGQHQERPDFVPGFARKHVRDAVAILFSYCPGSYPVDSLLIELSENRIRSHRGVLTVRAGFAFKRERLLKVESDDRIPCELEQKVSQRADSDCMSGFPLCFFSKIPVPCLYLGQRIRSQPIN